MNIEYLNLINIQLFCQNNFQGEISDASCKYFNELLSHRTFIINDMLSEADLYVYRTLSTNKNFIAMLKNDQVPLHLIRYFHHLASLDEVKKFMQQVPKEVVLPIVSKKVNKESEKSSSNSKFEEGGKFVGLVGAEEGKVVVRFPPEASGYLHIGHAKAALINQHYKDHYKGQLIMRFDDTNPAKESSEFECCILEDVKRLGLTYDKLTYTSDHFDTLIVYCEQMLNAGQAYVDNTDPETMKKERELCQESVCRSHSIEDNMKLWREMIAGSEIGARCCVRVRLDMASKNGCMRDPTIYRCKAESHVRTGDKYKVYPTYDFACPIVDSIEGVTHSLRTSEYNDRNEQFYAILDLIGLRKPAIGDYSRLSLQNTVLSKRKLTWIVANNYVDGWDDARMPTVRGVLRHGMTVEGLKEFVIAQGFGRANVVMEWDKIWAFNKKVIDPVAPRYSGLSAAKEDLVTVTVIGQSRPESAEVARHPKNEAIGVKTVWYTSHVIVERADAVDFRVGENVTFINWGNLMIESIDLDRGHVTAKLNLTDRDFKKTLKVTWLPIDNEDDTTKYTIPISVITYSDLITKNVLDKDDDFKTFINKDSEREECLLGDRDLSALKKGDIIQIQRKGYFICDKEYGGDGGDCPLVLINIPEGNKKERPTVGMKQKSGGENKKEERKSKEVKKEGENKEEKTVKEIKKEEEKKEANRKNDGETNKETKTKKVEKQKKDVKTKHVELTAEESLTGDNSKKKETRLCLEVTREENFSEWYSQVITKSKFIGYYDISGCYILWESPSFIWKQIQNYFDERILDLGVMEANFPMFVSKDALTKEKDHIADFSPEVAWVTMYGDKVMEKPIAVRPTSETIIYPAYAKSLQSYRNLPLKYNQWCNVVRWEFKNPVPLLRSREFLWQEGHTAFAEQAEAIEEVYEILDLYANVYEELLAIPVVKGRKTEKEKFAGGDFTTTTEIYIAGAGRAIQGATSHHLGQNFSKMFDVTFKSKEDKQEYVYQNSWGLTTRTLGIMVMTHSDNKGLVLPPRVAITQVVVVPCGVTAKSSEEEKRQLMEKCVQVKKRLQAVRCRVVADVADYVSPGWKYNHWEMKGVPIRIEIGPKDVATNTLVLCYRYNGVKETIPDADVESVVPRKMDEIHQAMYDAANRQLVDHRTVEYTMSGLCAALDKNMLITAPFCGDKDCEEQIKTISARDAVVEEGAPSMGAKSLCIPLEQPDNLGHKCVNALCHNTPKFFTMFGRSY